MEMTLDDAYLAKLKATAIDLTIHVKAELNITAFTARQKVNGLIVDNVGTGLISESPELVISKNRFIWRVPVILALHGRGRLGQVGTVDVDVQTGELLVDDSLLEGIARTANDLAQRTTL